MRRTVKLLALSGGLALLLAACGSPPDDNVEPRPAENPGAVPKVFSLYNPAEEIMPLPNDLVWLADGDEEVELDIEPDDSQEMQLLKQLINAMGIKGLSPNMFLTVPLSGAVDTSTLELVVFRLDDPTAENPRTVQSFEVVQDTGILKLAPKEPFTPGAYYAVAVRSTLRDTNGFPVAPSPVMNALKSTQSLKGTEFEKLESLRAAYNAEGGLFDALAQITQAALGTAWSRGDVLLLWTFHTADKTLDLATSEVYAQALKDGDLSSVTLSYDAFGTFLAGLKTGSLGWQLNQVEWQQVDGSYGDTPVPLPASAVWASPEVPDTLPNDAIGSIYFGRFQSVAFSSLTTDSPQALDVPFLVVVPEESDTCTGPWPAVVFQHGIGRSKGDALALANSLAKACLATFAIDAPYHGDRTPDGYESGDLFFTANLLQDRANLYQAAFDLWEAFDVVSTIDLDGGGGDLTVRGFAAHSLGSIIGSVFLSQDIRPDRILLSSPSGQLSLVLDQTGLSDLQGLVQSLGYTPGTTAYYVFLNLVQWLMDPVDGMYTGIGGNNRSKLAAIFAYDDPVVTDVASQLFLSPIFGSELAGAIQVVDPSDNTTFPGSDDGVYQYGLEGHPAVHSFLLNPAVGDESYYEGYDATDQLAFYQAAQAQAAAFFAATPGDND